MATDPYASYVELRVNINSETAAALKDLANHRSTNITETVRRAVAVLKFLEDEQRSGKEILLRNGKNLAKLDLQ